ncbi:MAG: DUF4430 domain-containing protein [Solirubrobacteraceae bacterium]|nr:DUF4430 domain-containing protein [Solirubrobacteraceae bacterium]
MPHHPATRIAACIATIVALGLPASAAAAPTDVLVRTEGATQTLFEGPLRADGHALRTPSDKTVRRCDGTNNGANPKPGPTLTSVTADAMRLAGTDFDGQWYPGFDDYFVTRFGPDMQDEGSYAYWGILLNGIFTSVGGCQHQLDAGDAAVWVYDAFDGRAHLRLDGPTGIGEPTADHEGGASSAPVQSTFVVGPGQPLTVTAVRNEASGTSIGEPGARVPAPGVTVAPVATAANGFQTVLVADPTRKVTDAAGRATFSWTTPGWKRLKAEGDGYVRSNRLDVCVQPCGPVPVDVALRSALPAEHPTPSGPTGDVAQAGEGSLALGGGTTPTPVIVDGLRIDAPRITTDGNPDGLVGVRWRIGAGATQLARWVVETRRADAKKARWVARTRGTTRTHALLDLPVGRVSEVRVRFTTKSGQSSVRGLGQVFVPRDDRTRQITYRGGRTQVRDGKAWRLSTTRMKRKARLTIRLPAGRPTIAVRSERRSARIEIRSGRGKAQRLTVKGAKDGRTRLISGRDRKRSSTVTVRVLQGTVRVDGVGVRP